ncbi:hypothetical protein HYV73_02790 [Candidatus Uhrbacteria bacterium]|nr:hypothetical protein [Candidatus Uhrbacteria bacterium]
MKLTAGLWGAFTLLVFGFIGGTMAASTHALTSLLVTISRSGWTIVALMAATSFIGLMSLSIALWLLERFWIRINTGFSETGGNGGEELEPDGDETDMGQYPTPELVDAPAQLWN